MVKSVTTTITPALCSPEYLAKLRAAAVREDGAAPNTVQELERYRNLLGHIDALEAERAQSRAVIAKVFRAIEFGAIDLAHHDGCPEDDTCECPTRRLMLELQMAGGDPKVAALLAEFDRAANPLFEIGVTREPWEP